MTTKTHFIEITVAQLQKEKWPFLKAYAALKEIGVESYDVKLTPNFEVFYHGSFGVWKGPTIDGVETLSPTETFSLQTVKEAITHHQQKQTSYQDFLHHIAAAGVTHYRVNMKKGVVTYYNADETLSHEELVPQL